MEENYQIVSSKKGADVGEFRGYEKGVHQGRIGGAVGGTIVSAFVTGGVVIGGAAAASPVLIGGAVAVGSFTILAGLGSVAGSFAAGFMNSKKGKIAGEGAARSGKNEEEIIQAVDKAVGIDGLAIGAATGVVTGVAVVGVTTAAAHVVINKPDLVLKVINNATSTTTATTNVTAGIAAGLTTTVLDATAVLIGSDLAQSDDSEIDSDVVGEVTNDGVLIGGT